MSEKILKQTFQKGLNKRVSKERSDGLNKLQNARLQERGSTLQVSRIEGYQQIAGDSTDFDVIYDSVVYDNDLVVYWYDSSSGEVVVTFIDVGGAGTTEKRFTDSQADYGELTLLENNIYLTPYDKQLNNISGTWYLNDFISTTPTFDVSGYYEGSIQVVDGAGTDSYATGSVDITSTTSTAGSTANGAISVDSNATATETFSVDFYGETVSVSVTDGDGPEQVASQIETALNNNTTIANDWTVVTPTVDESLVDITSKDVGDEWNGYNIVLNSPPFSFTLTEPTSGGVDNKVTLTFPEQPSDTVVEDTIATSDSQEDIAQKITDGINNKSGLDYSATRSGTTVNVTATEYGQNYNGTFGVSLTGLDFTYNKNDFTGGYKATGNFFTMSFGTLISDIDTQAFSSGDSNTQLAQYVYDALTSDTGFNDVYTAEISGDTITIYGSANSTLSVTEDISANNTTVNATNIQSGNSTLDDLTYYWYKLRFVYYDGHKTITSYPQLIKTLSLSEQVLIDNIDFETDLDQNLADIEVFRKKEGFDWFLIDRVTPDDASYVYIDDGKVNLQPLDERNYVWARNPRNQDIVRDRLVRANLEYQQKELGWEPNDVDIRKLGLSGNIDEDIFPKNVNVDIFGQGRYKDGTVSPHKKLGEIDVGSETAQLLTDPQNQPSNVDELNEVAYYAKYSSKEPVNLSFNSVEIYNQNIPSLATKHEAEEDQDKPINPHIFVGHKYVRVFEDISASERTYGVYDEDWQYDGTNYVGTDDSTDVTDDFKRIKQETIGSAWETSPPETIDIEFVSGVTLTYKIKYRKAGAEDYSFLFELAWAEPLKRSVSEGGLKVKLTNVAKEEILSSKHSNSDYIDNEVDVVGILDTSSVRQQAYVRNDLVHSTGKNHIYLILDSDSIYSEFDNTVLNNDNAISSTTVIPDFVYEFELINLEEKSFSGSTTTSSYSENSSITEVTVDYGLTEFSPVSEDQDELLYLGTQTDFDEDNTAQYSGYFEGYDIVKENLFEFQTLLDTSIFESYINDEELEQFQEDYPNQLVWGGSYILESNASGTRDFEFTNFKNISQNYGEIVAISYINNILLVFCERGVNRINIGEVLTQQSDSQVFVDSSALLNNDQWILKNVPDIKARSVTQYENMLFFCDGKDVWKYTDRLENISSGKVEFDIDQTFEGSVDPKNKEYQLTNGEETWVYSIELDLWQGPFTYRVETASAYRDNFYGVVGTDSVEFNSGNDFDGSSYDTVIESVANTLDDASVTKLFRKFYVETEGDATFSYGKEYGTWTDKTLSNYPDKNGVTHLGVNPSNKNGRQMYWKVTTQEQDFILQLVSLLLQVRSRR